MSKIALIYSFRPSSWVSCQKIVSNLVKAYKLQSTEHEIRDFSFVEGMDGFEFYQSYTDVARFKPDYLIFLDHKPHPVYFMSFLGKELKELGLKPNYIFHLFGDFTLNFQEWSQMDKFIKDRKVIWYTASPRQKNLISEFIPNDQIEICPFPVNPEEFYFDQGLRESSRKSFKWREDEFIFLFTGRLSRQKRIHQLIPAFSEWLSQNPVNAKLVLVGDSDKVGEPWLFKNEAEYEYYHRLLTIISKLPIEHQSRIELHGFKPNKLLINYYNAADCLVNISVHNDEDYGMSCAEAQACGLPLVLTDWAGFTGFKLKSIEDAVKFVPVRIDPKGKKIKINTLLEHLTIMFEKGRQLNRHDIQNTSLAWTSIESASKIVHKNLKNLKTFSKFEPEMEIADELERLNYRNTFTNKKKRTFNTFYLKVYRHYVGHP